MINGAAMNLQLGKMYLVKQYFWLLYPTKEQSMQTSFPPRPTKVQAASDSTRLSSHDKCSIGIVELNTCFVLLEQDEKVFKILDCNGNIGWIRCSDFSSRFKLFEE